MAPAAADKVARCIANNLHLCGAVLAPHGISGTISRGIWTSVGEVPPHYSNAVTVSPHDAEAQARGIEDLARVLDRPFSVKDSFAALDLAPQGFRALFTADWIWRDAGPPPAAGGSEPWRAIATPDDLTSWETTWRNNGSPADTRVFLPALLDDETMTIFARWRGGRVTAGCIANRSDGLVGFSNFFSATERWQPDLAAALATIAGAFPGRAIAGYEHGEQREAMIALGFEAVGPLRVWLSPTG